MAQPLVSVKMITYNHAPFIAQAIQSVLSQKTDFPFELVIGEDCSTDGTRDIVFEHQKKHPDIIRVITSAENVGMAKNSLRTAKACAGKYLAFCEGDDYWHDPLKLQKQVDYLESHPDCGLVYSSYDMYYVESKKRIKDYVRHRGWEMPKNPDISAFIEGRGGMGLGILTCTAVVPRTVHAHIVNADPYLHSSDRFLRGDTQLWAEIAHRFPIHFFPESLATYNQTEESATRSKDITKLIRLQLADADLGLYLCNKYNLGESTRNEMEAIKAYNLLRLAFYSRNAALAGEVRIKKKSFTWKEWFLYYGAKKSIFYYPFRLAASARSYYSKIYEQWL